MTKTREFVPQIMDLWSSSKEKERKELKDQVEKLISECVPEEISEALYHLGKQADGQKTNVRLSSEEDCFIEVFNDLNDDEKLALERLYDLMGRVISFLSGGLIVHPNRLIEEDVRKSQGRLYHLNCRRSPR